jgi:hypothetical protein
MAGVCGGACWWGVWVSAQHEPENRFSFVTDLCIDYKLD